MKRLILVFALLCPAGVLATFSGNDLLELCLDTGAAEPRANDAKYQACLTFLGNISETPRWASQEYLRQLWLKYAEKHPQELSWDAATVVSNTFDDAFPIDYE